MNGPTKIIVQVEFTHSCGAAYSEVMTLSMESTVTVGLDVHVAPLEHVDALEFTGSVETESVKPKIEVAGSVSSVRCTGMVLRERGFICKKCGKGMYQ